MNSQQPKAKPVSKLRDGKISAAIWANTSQEGKTAYSVSFSRTYQDGDGNYKDSSSFSATDLLKLARLAGQAYDEIKRLYAAADQQEAE
jgi:hypothetical protein